MLVTPLFMLGVFGLVAYFRRKNVQDEDLGIPGWTPLEAVGITIAIYIVSQILGAIIIGFVVLTHNGSVQDINNQLSNSVWLQFLFVVIVETITVLMVLNFVRRRKTVLRLIGVVRPRLRDIAYVAKMAVPTLNVTQKQDLGFSATASGLSLVPIFIGLVVLPPLVEEFITRGFLYSGLRTKLSFLPAAIITSVMFAAAHLQAGSGNSLLWIAAVDTFTLSMVLVFLREKTGSLWPCVGLHALKNGLAFVAIFIFHSV
jgi:membrane protease YdiL (CAAX protease family)